MNSPNISGELIIFCMSAVILQLVVFAAAILFAIHRINNSLHSHLAKILFIIEDMPNHVGFKIDNEPEKTQKTETNHFGDANHLGNAVAIFSEMQTIQRDTRSILHDSRHIQNENLQMSYAIRSTMNEIFSKIDTLSRTQDAALRTISTISIQSDPLIDAYINAFGKNLENNKIDNAYQFERCIELVRPTLVIQKVNNNTAIISTISNEEDRRQVELCLESHKNYAQNHGYAYYLQNQQPIHQLTNPSSNKISLIFSLLNQGFETVFFVASSAMFTNLNKRIESLTGSFESNKACFVVTENELGVDLTVFAVKNCADSKIILNLMWLLQRHAAAIGSEEDALNYLLNKYDCVRRKVNIEKDSKKFNSEPREKGLSSTVLEGKIWSDGDMICNFSGFRPPHLESLVKRYGASLAFRAGNRTEAIAHGQENLIQSIDNKDILSGGTISCSILGRWGQFGNQLFQIAAVFGYAKKYGSQVILPRWHCVMSEQDHGAKFPKVQAYYGQQPLAEPFYEKNYAYNDIPYKDHVDLQGSFQSEKYFFHARAQIKDLFSEPEEIKIRLDKFIEKYDCRIFDALHVRNYLHPTRDIGFGDMERLPEEYFIAAIQRLNDTIPLFVATDKRDFVSELFRKTGLKRRIVMMDTNDPLMDFYMLSRSRRIAISNSSFSWWSAYLGSEKENVIAPHRYYWFSSKGRNNPHYDTRDLYPSNFEEIIM
ncbi:putative glycosyltransferase [Methylobacterium sp. GXS13]|uniref:alpha-1,2-fucosyltransferase n=1 Tax=Methylobacterium sp. GXS13 TaxID=1730094 RepID=UPI000723C8EF|nr:alpha-1,2-fucosyltransferase [Methylobacterium sp. GXS13]KST59844.1 putative glycosyltransferase [Methylobacterium sp. GXS13]